MKKATKYTLLALLAVVALGGIYLLDAELFNHALAKGAGGVFDKGEEKGNELAEALRGKIAVTITTIVMCVVGILMQMGRIQHMVGVRILVGVFIIGGSAGIAEWAYA